MSRGVHRLHINVAGGSVKVRAQSKSPRGTPYTVKAVQVEKEGPGRVYTVKALRAALTTLLE
jgi:hypothetical protein